MKLQVTHELRSEVDRGPDWVELAMELATEMATLDRRLRRAGETIPPPEAMADLTRAFWAFVDRASQHEVNVPVDPAVRLRCRDVLGRWLFRSRHWNRAYFKPHGYAGDFRIIEWAYDLETDAFVDATQPALVNCLDHLFSTIPAVVGLWQRRHRFGRLLQREHARRGGRLRILDVACGGARYLRDFLEIVDPSGVEITLVDQDPAALAYCRTTSLASWADRIELRRGSILELAGLLADHRFDLVISAGLLDYLNDALAGRVLRQLAAHLATDGIIAFSNFHPDDPSRLVKDWLLDWPLVYRDEAACAALLPTHLEVTTSRSENGVLSYATGCLGQSTK